MPRHLRLALPASSKFRNRPPLSIRKDQWPVGDALVQPASERKDSGTLFLCRIREGVESREEPENLSVGLEGRRRRAVFYKLEPICAIEARLVCQGLVPNLPNFGFATVAFRAASANSNLADFRAHTKRGWINICKHTASPCPAHVTRPIGELDTIRDAHSLQNLTRHGLHCRDRRRYATTRLPRHTLGACYCAPSLGDRAT